MISLQLRIFHENEITQKNSGYIITNRFPFHIMLTVPPFNIYVHMYSIFAVLKIFFIYSIFEVIT